MLKRKSGRFEEDLRETLWRVSVPHTGMPLRVRGSGEAVWAFLHSSVGWNVTVRRDVFLPTVRPDSDGSKRAARRRTCPPLAWMECTYQNLVLVTAVATETASQACVSVTWDTRVRPTCASESSLRHRQQMLGLLLSVSKNSRTWPPKYLSCWVSCSFEPPRKKTC